MYLTDNDGFFHRFVHFITFLKVNYNILEISIFIFKGIFRYKSILLVLISFTGLGIKLGIKLQV